LAASAKADFTDIVDIHKISARKTLLEAMGRAAKIK
jgi:hypothetical protein